VLDLQEAVMQLVALTVGDRFLQVTTADGETRLRADGTSVSRAGSFERVDLGHDRVALRTVDGGYLTHAPDRGRSFGLYVVDELTPCAAFEEVLWPDGRISLRSCQLTYLCADADRGIVTSCLTQTGDGTRFRYVAAPLGSMPRQQRRTAPVGQPRSVHLS
jgi:hypothetical protein